AQLHQRPGRFEVTVFAAPTPPRVGPVDISVLAQDRMDGRVALDGEVFVRLRSEGGTIVVGRATREASRNNIFYSASMNLPEAGGGEMGGKNKTGKRAGGGLGAEPVGAPRPVHLSLMANPVPTAGGI